MHGKLVELAVSDYVDALASGEAAPGGGSASALAGALAAALASMVAGLTVGRPRYRQHDAAMRELEANAVRVRSQLMAIVDDDTACYKELMAAYRLPKDTDAEKATRSEAIEHGLKRATEAPLATVEACAEVLRLAEAAACNGNTHARSDAVVAALLAHAALRGAERNARTNLPGIRDLGFKAAAEERLAAAVLGAEATLAGALRGADCGE